ncbi:MAG: hypothetical protein MJ230_05900 [bacterium]|nr:hypothetical protein [bacterium]
MGNEKPISYNSLKIRSSFQKNVEDAIRTGKRTVCDTKEEYAALQELLSGGNINEDEMNFVESKMQEYKEKYEYDDLKKRASDYVKKFVKNIKEIVQPKQKLNIDEVHIVLDELKRAIDESRYDDAEYLRAELIKGGYENELQMFEDKIKESTESTQETPSDDTVSDKPSSDSESPNEPDNKPLPEPTPAPNPNPKPQPQPEPTPAPNPNPEPPEETPSHNNKLSIAENDRIEGNGAAEAVEKEVDSNYASNDAINKALSKVNDKNAYNFFKTYMEKSKSGGKIMEDVMDISDKFNRITFSNLEPAARNLVEQAGQIEEDQTVTSAANKLTQDLDTIQEEVTLARGGDLTTEQAKLLDKDIKALVEAMGSHIE